VAAYSNTAVHVVVWLLLIHWIRGVGSAYSIIEVYIVVALHIYIYICIHVHTYIDRYIYVYVNIYIYIYIYIYI